MHLSYSYKNSKKNKVIKEKPLKLSRNKKKRSVIPFIKGVGWILFFSGLSCILIIIAGISWYSRDLPNPNKLLTRAIPVSTRIYDRTGKNILYEIHGDQQRTLITLEDIPQNLISATIVAEDRGFYTHKGFDFKGMIRALLVDVFTRAKAQGGSTITQQFIKNALLTKEKSLERKIKELILAYTIEKKFTKDQILQMYFNEIPYGSTAYGLHAASKLYFGKNISTLSLSESALLAILPRAPSYYSPWGPNRDKLIIRQHKLLDDMEHLGYITQKDVVAAKNEKLQFKRPFNSITAPHFVMYIKGQLEQMYGRQLVEEGGLEVITTLDIEKQKIAERIIQEQGQKNLSMNASNAAFVSLDTQTGEILSLIGSRDYFNESIDGNVNVVLRKRQPGSSFKPIVYAAAFQKGYTPQTILFDVLTNFDTTGLKEYKPHNYTGKEYGPISMKRALAGSLNIASVKTLYLAGVSYVIEFAKKCGYTSLQNPDQYGLALVLGGGEVTLLEHTAAFSGFAQEGIVSEPTGILQVKDKQGLILYTKKESNRKEVFEKEIAQHINEILSDNTAREYIFGKKNYLILEGREAAVKTGTTNDYRDAWTIGYTPSVVTGVWVGNNNNTPMKKGADGSKLAAPIWNSYMKEILKDTPQEFFTKPLSIITGKAVLDGSYYEETPVTLDKTTMKTATENTPQEQKEVYMRRNIHTILHSVIKDDPRGLAPENPTQDPQYYNWEQQVQRWLKKNNIKNEELINEQNQPSPLQTQESHTLSFITPQDQETITSPILTSHITTTSPNGISKVNYYLDDKLIQITQEFPYSLFHELTLKDNGFHTLTAKSYDTQKNIQVSTITLNILLPQKNNP